MSIRDNILSPRIPDNVLLVAATKTRTVNEISHAIKAGITAIGENYVQEAESKLELKGQVRFHCIGHLQRNKVKKAVRIFDVIQTVDSFRIADEINKRSLTRMPVFIEVNIAGEHQKHGICPEDLMQFIKDISSLGNLDVQGLMTMGPFFKQKESYRPLFRKMKELFDRTSLKYLSMGMSDSYDIAIEEGANVVRIGTKIFGPRALP